MDEPGFRAYEPADRVACLALFDANCPAAFAPNERDEYAAFLDEGHDGYEVCVDGEAVVGAYGLVRDGAGLALRWILIGPAAQGRGLGAGMMERVAARAREEGVERVRISASQVSAPFFARFGARERSRTVDGWGPGMHRVEMELGV